MSCGIFNNENKWRELGDYDLKRVEIITNNDQKADIKDLIQEMNIFEDMFGVYMSGNITFKDSGGFVEKLPIIGNEMVEIEIRTPGVDKYKKYEFCVFQVSGNEKVGPEAAAIVKLQLCSLEMVANSITRLSKSVKGSHDTIAGDIFIEQFGSLGKTFTAEPARTEIKMVLAMNTPMDMICWLSSGAVSAENDTPSYVVFENHEGYHFVTIESLKTKPPSFDYLFDPSVKTKLDPEKEVMKVLDLKQDIAPNTLLVVGAGVHGSKTIYHDPITKNIVTGKYEDDIKPTLSGKKTTVPSKLKSLASKSDQYTTYRCVNPDLYGEGERSSSETAFDVEGRRKSYLTQMFSNRLVITVSGNTILDIGDTVKFTAKSQSDDSKDRSISGRYIISAICHNIGPKGHFSTVELITDGFASVSKGITK